MIRIFLVPATYFVLLGGIALLSRPPGAEQIAAPRETTPTKLNFPPREGTYEIIPYRVVDGDTVHFWWLVPDTARLHGIDAPELRGPTKLKGFASRDFLKSSLPKRPPTVKAVVRGRGKYGRVLVELWMPGLEPSLGGSGPVNINHEMVQRGHAVKYPK